MHCLPLLDPAPLVVGTAVGLVVGTTVGVLSLAVGTTVFLLVGTTARGVYRIKAINTGGTEERTECIPYHADVTEMKEKLDALSMIINRGGVTVRRYGDGSRKFSRYGYRWRIDMDSVRTTDYSSGAIDLQIACIGFNEQCKCAVPKVALRDRSGQRLVQWVILLLENMDLI